MADDQGLLVVGGADALQRCGEGLAYAMKAFLKILQFVLEVLQLTPHLCTAGPECGVFDYQGLQFGSTLQRDFTLGLEGSAGAERLLLRSGRAARHIEGPPAHGA